MSMIMGRVSVKHLAPLRAPNAVMRRIEQELHTKRMQVGPFILASMMKNLGYSAQDVRASVKLAYPRRWQKEEK